MEPLAAAFVESLKGAQPDLEALARAGETDPQQAAEAFRRAASEPRLAAQVEAWAPALLGCARPGFGAQALVELSAALARAGGPELDLRAAPGIPRVLGSSNVLARQLLRHPEWVDELRGAPPEPLPTHGREPDWTAIRRAKYRGLLRVAARDLLARPFAESPGELSDLADHCLASALECAARETEVGAPVLFGLGKLGGVELNFSSDVDLLFVYASPDREADLEQNQRVSRLVQHLKARLEEPTEDGFAYRVDLDLRPEGRSGVLVNSVDAALAYYESFGAEWERQMLIRLRFVAGPAPAARAFSEGIVPFVYRRLIDPDVLRAVREMKARIEEERRRAGRDLESDLKEGPGGIRDVEFLVQALQLFHGARHPELRVGGVLEALGALRRLGLFPEASAAALGEAYAWLRRAEHALQLAEEQQTHHVPRDRAARTALARRMGYAQPAGEVALERLLDDWTAVRSEVRNHFEALVLRDEA